MSSSPMIVITNFVGTKVNAANVGVGLQNPDGTYNVSGTVIGLGQTAQSAVDFAMTGVKTVSKWVPGVGAALGVLGTSVSYDNITRSIEEGKSPAQADIAGAIGGVAAAIGGAALILGGGVIVPVSVVVGVAAGTWQLVAAAKGWTVDDLGFPVEQPLSDAEKSQVVQSMKDLANQSAYTDAMDNALGSGSLVPVDEINLWSAPEAFEPADGLAKALEMAIEDAMQAARDAGETAQQAVEAIGNALSSLFDTLPLPLGGVPADFIFDFLPLWVSAKQTVSPLILDLDGDGLVETQSKTEDIYFDHAGDGFAEATGWAGADDGLLVRDLNGDGAINNGTELFGNNTRLKNGQYAANGFEALKDLDSNKDGKLNSADAAWNSLRVWKDTDADAQTDAGELLSLANAGVREIKLAYTNAGTNPDQLGNEHRQTSTYTTTSGAVRAVHDVWFGTDNWNTVDQRTPIELNSTVAAMPEVIGSGTLGSLRQAMMRDTTGQLITAVNKYLTTSNLAQRDSLLQDMFYRWAGMQDHDPTRRRPKRSEQIFEPEFLRENVMWGPAE